MPMFHFRRSDYEEFQDFTRPDLFGDLEVRKSIRLPRVVYLAYSNAIEHFRRRKMVLYEVRDGTVRSYAEFEPPIRTMVLQRVLSQHLALEYWLKEVTAEGLGELNDEFIARASSTAWVKVADLLLDTVQKRTRLEGAPTKYHLKLNVSYSAMGMFSHPHFLEVPIFNFSFAFTYSLARFLSEQDFIPVSLRSTLEKKVVEPYKDIINNVLVELMAAVRELLEEPPSPADILLQYLQEVRTPVVINPFPPVDLTAKFKEYGYSLWDLLDAVRGLYNAGKIQAELEPRPDGGQVFRKIWLG